MSLIVLNFDDMAYQTECDVDDDGDEEEKGAAERPLGTKSGEPDGVGAQAINRHQDSNGGGVPLKILARWGIASFFGVALGGLRVAATTERTGDGVGGVAEDKGAYDPS